MDNPFLNYLHDNRRAGALAGATASGSAGDAACGALVEIFIDFKGESISRAGFLAYGSDAAIAAASCLTEMITGAGWRQAAAVSIGELVSALGHERGEDMLYFAAEAAVAALHAALEDALSRGSFPLAARVNTDAVLVAMSGGVDSSVAAMLLSRAGLNATGLTMRLWSDPSCAAAAGCCSPEAIADARSVCHALGIPHLTVDLSKEFELDVVADFIAEYSRGRTPNPCARCNGSFRFPRLAGLANLLGARRIATGHYARVRRGEYVAIARGKDARKDQSYMLWGVQQELLDRLEFPLGSYTKEDVRRLARQNSLATQARPESQEVCFIPDDDYRRFLRAHLRDAPGAGDIISAGGRRLGRHTGYIDYTAGQRRGLGVSAGEPLYVLGTRPEENLVVAGSRSELAVGGLEVGQLNVVTGLRPGDDSMVQVRYNSPPVAARIAAAVGGRLSVDLSEPVYGVAPGQSAVFYDGDAVSAGGIIEATFS